MRRGIPLILMLVFHGCLLLLTWKELIWKNDKSYANQAERDHGDVNFAKFSVLPELLIACYEHSLETKQSARRTTQAIGYRRQYQSDGYNITDSREKPDANHLQVDLDL